VFTGRVSLAEHPWLLDHAVTGTPLFPGTGFLDLALHVGDVVRAPEVNELTLESPLVLNGNRAFDVRVSVGPEDETGLQHLAIHSRSDDGTESWERHAVGQLARTEQIDTSRVEWPPLGAEEIDIASLYDDLEVAGFDYGSAFQGVQQVWAQNDSVFVRVSTDVNDTGGTLPFIWSGVRIQGSTGRSLIARVSANGNDSVSIQLADESGHLIGSIDKLALRPLPDGGLMQRTETQLTWVPAHSDKMISDLSIVVVDQLLDQAGGFRTDLDALRKRLQSTDTIDAVVLSVPVQSTSISVPARAHKLALSVLSFLQEWLADPAFEKTTVVVSTSCATAASSSDSSALNLAQAPLWGLVRSAQNEHPGRIVIVDTESDTDPIEAARVAMSVGEPQLSIRNDVHLVPRLNADYRWDRWIGVIVRRPSG